LWKLFFFTPALGCSKFPLINRLEWITPINISTVIFSIRLCFKDKRIKIVKPTPEFVNEFEKWSDEFYSDDNWVMKTDYKKI
jgi:hypothetical protein